MIALKDSLACQHPYDKNRIALPPGAFQAQTHIHRVGQQMNWIVGIMKSPNFVLLGHLALQSPASE
jgi:hypothetical protein